MDDLQRDFGLLFDEETLATVMQELSQRFMPAVGRMVEAFIGLGSALGALADWSWQMEYELCFREYARRMNAGPWRWRKRSWRRLNIRERTEARAWWNMYGREVMRKSVIVY